MDGNLSEMISLLNQSREQLSQVAGEADQLQVTVSQLDPRWMTTKEVRKAFALFEWLMLRQKQVNQSIVLILDTVLGSHLQDDQSGAAMVPGSPPTLIGSFAGDKKTA